MNQKYTLWLKKVFTKKTLLALLLLLVIVFLSLFLSKTENFLSKKRTGGKLYNKTVGEVVQLDSDGDGFYDWEEGLWGTDKFKKSTFPNMTDAEYISQKKIELAKEQTEVSTDYNETQKFAIDFLASYLALKDGKADEETILGYTNAIGQKLAEDTIIDTYLAEDAVIKNTSSTDDQLAYYKELTELFEKYKTGGIGDEINIVSSGLLSGRSEDYDELDYIAEAYQGFAKDAMLVGVPVDLLEIHMKITNSANNTGISITNMSKVASDPIVGLSGLSQYEKYSALLIEAVEELRMFFE